MTTSLGEAFDEAACHRQERLSNELLPRYDYIVCGAGTSGCVVAARLAADTGISVLVLEAGGSDDTDLVWDPNRWPLALGSPLDWGFVAEPNPNLNGRLIPYAMERFSGAAKTTPELDSPNFFTYAKHGPLVSPENQARFKPPAASWSLG